MVEVELGQLRMVGVDGTGELKGGSSTPPTQSRREGRLRKFLNRFEDATERLKHLEVRIS